MTSGRHYLVLFFLVSSSVFLITGNSRSASAEESLQQTFVRDTAWNSNYSKGMALYKEECAACHGEDGEGGTKEDEIGLPLNLQSFLIIAPKDYIVKTIKNGRPSRGMPDFVDSLSDNDVNAIALYIKSWQYQPSKELETGVVLGDPFKGKEWYRGICAGCHGVNGEGGPQESSGGPLAAPFTGLSAPALADIGFQKSASDGFLKAALIYGRIGTPMTSFLKGYQGVVELSENDINDLVSYIRIMPSLE
jgi:cytochrome c oxidase cbb3-type subunit 3